MNDSMSSDMVAVAPNGAKTDVVFVYEAADPYAVKLEFPKVTGSPVWTFATDLLSSGIILGDGAGDVVILPVEDKVLITFRSPQGPDAELTFEYEDLCNALLMSEEMVPLGRESMDFDAELAKLATS
jgi:hypothetical protein